jgi:hypothetical protein
MPQGEAFDELQDFLIFIHPSRKRFHIIFCVILSNINISPIVPVYLAELSTGRVYIKFSPATRSSAGPENVLFLT